MPGMSHSHQLLTGPTMLGALAALSVTTPARADDEFFLGTERLMGVYWQRQSRTIEQGGVEQKTSERTTSVGVLALRGATAATVPRVAFDVFVTDQLTVGGSFIYTTYSQSAVFSAEGNAQDQEDDIGSGSIFVLAPRVGYRMPLATQWGFWPRAGFSFASQSDSVITDQQSDTERKVSRTTLSFLLDAMFYVQPIEHLAILGGPFLDLGMLYGSYSSKLGSDTQVEGDERLTAFGVAFGLGAFF